MNQQIVDLLFYYKLFHSGRPPIFRQNRDLESIYVLSIFTIYMHYLQEKKQDVPPT